MKLKFIKNSFFKSVAIIAGGTFSAQLITLLSAPVITRIYSPEEYGVLTTFAAALGLLTLSAFKYEMAIPIEKNKKMVYNLLILCLIILILFTALITILLMVFGNFIFTLFDSSSLFKYRYLIPLGVFLSGLYIILRLWNFREKNYKTISKTTINQSIFSNAFKITMGFLGAGPLGLILGTIIGKSAGIKKLSNPIIKVFKEINEKFDIKKVVYTANRYKKFPIYNAPNKFLISLGTQLPIIFLASFYGSKVVGSYGLAFTVVKLPMNLVGKAVGDVFFAEGASTGRENPKKLKKLSNQLIVRLILLGLIPLLTLLFFGTQLFTTIFGPNWYQAGVYSQVISIMLFFTLVFTPISRVYEIFEKQKEKLVIDIIRVIFIILVFMISWYFNFSAHLSILLYTIVMSSVYFITYIFAQRFINLEIKNNL